MAIMKHPSSSVPFLTACTLIGCLWVTPGCAGSGQVVKKRTEVCIEVFGGGGKYTTEIEYDDPDPKGTVEVTGNLLESARGQSFSAKFADGQGNSVGEVQGTVPLSGPWKLPIPPGTDTFEWSVGSDAAKDISGPHFVAVDPARYEQLGLNRFFVARQDLGDDADSTSYAMQVHAVDLDGAIEVGRLAAQSAMVFPKPEAVITIEHFVRTHQTQTGVAVEVVQWNDPIDLFNLAANQTFAQDLTNAYVAQQSGWHGAALLIPGSALELSLSPGVTTKNHVALSTEQVLVSFEVSVTK